MPKCCCYIVEGIAWESWSRNHSRRWANDAGKTKTSAFSGLLDFSSVAVRELSKRYLVISHYETRLEKISPEAERNSLKSGAVPVVLINGLTIVDIMIENEFGIETEQLPVYNLALDLAVAEEN